MSESNPPRRSVDGGTFAWFLGAATLAAIALVVSVIAIFTPTSSATTEGGTGGAAASGDGASKTIKVELGEMYIEPASIDLPAGTVVTFEVTNAGAMEHDFKIEGESGTDMIKPGESATFEAGAIDASTQAWCTVPGHKDAGMVMAINVTDDGSSGAVTAHDATAATAAGTAADDSAKIDPKAEPADDWKPRDPVLGPPLTGTVHDITFHMTEKEMEVAPGVTQLLWTFEDQVPGPTLRGKVGDTFNVTIVNDGTMQHSIDFHASKVAWNDEMRSIDPGQSLVYTYTATNAGIFMYHCGTAPTLHHIGNGMYGAVVIDPPNLTPVDHEYVLVQSEFYLGPQGEPGSLAKMQNDAWDAVVFNGYHSQYKFAPIQVQSGERIRVWVLDAGPSENSSFHVVGTIFDTVWKEGAFLLKPDGTNGGSQAMDLQPAQGGYVEFTLAEDGFYPIVTHKFSNVGKGAIGLFRAGDVELAGGGGH